jgi:hypothetical protein
VTPTETSCSPAAAGLAGFLLANPAGYLQGVFDTMRASSALVLSGGDDLPTDADGIEAVVEPLQGQLHDGFVGEPHSYINWGRSSDQMAAQCRDARDLILRGGPHGSGDLPRMVMAAAGCEAEAAWNHDPNATRLFGAVLMAVAAVVMLVLIGLVALTVVIAQVIAVVLFVLLPFAALAAILPGAGRELAWRWMASLLRVVLVVVGMSALLSLMLLSIDALLSAPALGMIERFALVNIAVIAMFVARKKIIASGSQLAARVDQGLRVGPGRGAGVGWGSSPTAAGVSGFGVASSLGTQERPGVTRQTHGAMREQRASRRMDKLSKSSERRAHTTSARERTEITAGPDGTPQLRRSPSVDGPVPTTRRARQTRARVEAAAASRAAGPTPPPTAAAAPRRNTATPRATRARTETPSPTPTRPTPSRRPMRTPGS